MDPNILEKILKIKNQPLRNLTCLLKKYAWSESNKSELDMEQWMVQN